MIFTFRNATATIHIFSLTLSTKEQELIQEKQKMEENLVENKMNVILDSGLFSKVL